MSTIGPLMSSRPSPSPHRPRRSRSEAKEITHLALHRAALKLLSRNSFDSISLREVTRQAGISPTAFYRHFDDMEELGLELVEASFVSLRQMIRNARDDPALPTDAIRRSVEVVVEHVEEHTPHMRFIARERYGGVRRLRRAIRRELQLFADELAVDLAAFPVVDRWEPEDRRMLANLITEIMVHMAAELLDTPPERIAAITQQAEDHMRLAVMGSLQWRSSPGSTDLAPPP